MHKGTEQQEEEDEKVKDWNVATSSLSLDLQKALNDAVLRILAKAASALH